MRMIFLCLLLFVMYGCTKKEIKDVERVIEDMNEVVEDVEHNCEVVHV